MYSYFKNFFNNYVKTSVENTFKTLTILFLGYKMEKRKKGKKMKSNKTESS